MNRLLQLACILAVALFTLTLGVSCATPGYERVYVPKDIAVDGLGMLLDVEYLERAYCPRGYLIVEVFPGPTRYLYCAEDLPQLR